MGTVVDVSDERNPADWTASGITLNGDTAACGPWSACGAETLTDGSSVWARSVPGPAAMAAASRMARGRRIVSTCRVLGPGRASQAPSTPRHRAAGRLPARAERLTDRAHRVKVTAIVHEGLV